MKRLKFFLLSGLLAVLMVSCWPGPKRHDLAQTTFPDIDEPRLDSSVYYLLDEIPDSVHPHVYWLKQMYAANHYRAFWMTPERIKKCDTLLMFVNRSEEHGIPYTCFISDSLRYTIHQIKTERTSYYELAKADIQLTFTYFSYASALIYGIVHPRSELPNYHFKTALPDSIFAIKTTKHYHGSLTSFLIAMQNKGEAYKQLQQERKYWLQFRHDSFPVISMLPYKKTLRAGDKSILIPQIIRRLKITGNIASTFPDTLTVLNKPLFDALMALRKKAGIDADAEVGNATLRMLNRQPKEWIKIVDVNMERMRWQTIVNGKKKYVRVNVADMTLKAWRADSVALFSKVCVGNPAINKTPFLDSRISEVVLNPQWSVPSSIVVKEISKKVVTDTAYFRRNQMKVYHKGSEVDPTKIDWTKVSKSNQPYRLVQDAGEINSLGRIKFNFANPYGVYLHDTNAKRAFGRYNRAVSHGCVRVEKPLDLALFCLPDIAENQQKQLADRSIQADKIRHAIHLPVISEEGKRLLAADSLRLKSNRLWISPSVPLLVEYLTCFTNEKGKPVYRPDVYRMDEPLDSLLRLKFTLPVLFR